MENCHIKLSNRSPIIKQVPSDVLEKPITDDVSPLTDMKGYNDCLNMDFLH